MRLVSLFLLLFISITPLFGIFNEPFKKLIWVYLGSILFLSFCAYLWGKKWARLIAFLLVAIWTANSAISLVIWLEYKDSLNTELAITILSTNTSEIVSFFLSYWEALPVTILTFLFSLFVVIKVSKNLTEKFLFIAACIFILLPSYKFVELACKPRLHSQGFLYSEKILPYTSLVNLATFMRGIKELETLQAISDNVPEYNLSVKDTGIDTYIIVVGESVRRANMSLYSYKRNTTPNLLQQKRNLLIFENAVSPAPLTMLSVAHILSRKEVNNSDSLLITDNIINLVNAAGFETYWFSRQGKIGRFDTMITAIANAAQHKEWLEDSEYDAELFQKLFTTLSENTDKKRLIVIHTTGSHSLACQQYPESEHHLTDGESYHADCYDNSILYLDKLLALIFERTSTQKVSVLYFSDHGQIKRRKYNNVDYVHDSIEPVKQAVNVPQFIWFSPMIAAEQKKVGSVKELYTLSDNYYLIYDWLGITKVKEKNVHSPLNSFYVPRDEKDIKVIDSHNKIYNYLNLDNGN